MPVRFFRLGFYGLIVFATIAHAKAADCRLNKLTSFDAKLVGNQIQIAAQVDGETVAAVLDTGSPYNLIDKALADKLQLPMERIREGSMIDVTGASMKHMTKAHSVTVGDLKTTGTPFFVMGETGKQQIADIILGANFLEANDLELDLAHGKINMFPPDHCPGQVVYWTHEFVPIPIRLMNGGHIILPVTLNGVETHAMLDTGAGSTFVSKQLARSKLDIDPVASGDQPDGYAIGGTGAKLPFYRHIFDSLDVGGIQFHHTQLRIAPDTLNWITNNEVHDPQGILLHEDTTNTPITLGMTHIAKLRLYFSFREQMLYVTPANAQ
jgi:predicted aspartyl protease